MSVPDALSDPLLAAHAVVEADYRDHGVVHAERRKAYKLLDLVVHAVCGDCGGGYIPENDVDSIGHKGHECLHEDRRDAYLVDFPDHPEPGTQKAETGIQLCPGVSVKEQRIQPAGYKLSDDGMETIIGAPMPSSSRRTGTVPILFCSVETACFIDTS